MISPLSSEMAAATSSLTPGGSCIAPSTRESREELEATGPKVSLRGPISSSAPFSESRSLGEADNLTMRVAGLEALPDTVWLQQGPPQPAPQGATAHGGAASVYRLDQLVQAEVAPRSCVQDHPGAGVVGTEGDDLLWRVAAAQRGEVLDQSPGRPCERGMPVQPVPL